MTISAHSVKIIEFSLAELDALLVRGTLSRIAQQQGEKTAREMRAMLAEAKARPPCSCEECDVDSEKS